MTSHKRHGTPITGNWTVYSTACSYQQKNPLTKGHWCGRRSHVMTSSRYSIRSPFLIPSAIHYIDVIMTTMASQITSLTVVYSTVYSDADQRKHQSSASLAFVWGIHRDRWIPRTKGQLRGRCFHLMTSSCTGDSGFTIAFSHLSEVLITTMRAIIGFS